MGGRGLEWTGKIWRGGVRKGDGPQAGLLACGGVRLARVGAGESGPRWDRTPATAARHSAPSGRRPRAVVVVTPGLSLGVVASGGGREEKQPSHPRRSAWGGRNNPVRESGHPGGRPPSE